MRSLGPPLVLIQMIIQFIGKAANHGLTRTHSEQVGGRGGTLIHFLLFDLYMEIEEVHTKTIMQFDTILHKLIWMLVPNLLNNNIYI